MKWYRIFLIVVFIFSYFHQIISQNLNPGKKWAFIVNDSLLSTASLNDSIIWDSIFINQSWEGQGYPDFDGYGYYRISFKIDQIYQNTIEQYGGLRLLINNIDDADALYINNLYVDAMGSFPPDYKSKYGEQRDYIIPDSILNIPGENILTTIVYDAGGQGGIISEDVILRPLSIIDNLNPEIKVNDDDHIFQKDETVEFLVSVSKSPDTSISCNLCLEVKTDDNKPVTFSKKAVHITNERSVVEKIEFEPTKPGFYKCTVSFEINNTRGNESSFLIGYQPEEIISPVDSKKDFYNFWQNTLNELKKIKPHYNLTKLPEYSKGKRDLYHVSMYSLGNVLIEGYYAVPKGDGKYPAIIGYMGYGSDPYMPTTDNNPEFVEFILSVRGQGLQKPVNTYGDWILWGLNSKEEYYYRGAFMDLIRAIDFVESRPEVDPDKIVAEGGSQGGAFTFVASALDKRIKACAPTVPFLSDYKDYFKVAVWPGNVFINYLKENPEITWDRIYELLSYFDIKNFAPYIKCPLLMSVGLKDEVCPPHINFAAYNQVGSPKKYYAFPNVGHGVPDEWYSIRMDFFKEQLGIK